MHVLFAFNIAYIRSQVNSVIVYESGAQSLQCNTYRVCTEITTVQTFLSASQMKSTLSMSASRSTAWNTCMVQSLEC